MRSISPESAKYSLIEFAKSFDDQLLGILPDPKDMEQQVIEAMQYALLDGGKRLRPFLIMQSASLFDIDELCAQRVACAIECVHTYSLIHDDLPAMDDDDMRRGKLSVHKRYDEATAILAGDALLTLAFEILVDKNTHSDPSVRCELIASLARAAGALGMVGGQMIDLKAENQPLQQEQIKRMQQMKTGALIVFCCEAGAILAKVADERREALIGYANNIGLAFQIVDDLLDVESSSEDIGKTAGKDAQAGKATFVSLMGVSEAKRTAEALIEDATNQLQLFDEKADVLRSLASFVLRRAH